MSKRTASGGYVHDPCTFDRKFNPSRYGLLVEELLFHEEPHPLPLGLGTPNGPMKAKLEGTSRQGLPPVSRPLISTWPAPAIAGLWLYHDFLDESHTISQEIATPTGSYWHGIMHRREPDASNAKYWFRRVGDHPVFAELAEEMAELGFLGMELGFLGMGGMRQGPFAFVDSCSEVQEVKRNGCAEWMVAEWELLFEWCYQRAVRRLL